MPNIVRSYHVEAIWEAAPKEAEANFCKKKSSRLSNRLGLQNNGPDWEDPRRQSVFFNNLSQCGSVFW